MEAHLKGIGLENFRVFKDKTWFDFASITVLTGTNNSGKSSLVRGIQLLSNFFEKRKAKVENNKEDPDFMDIEDLLDTLGDFSKILNNTSNNKIISFYLPFHMRGILPKLKLKLDFKLQKGSLKQGKLEGLTVLISDNNEEIYHYKEIGNDKYNIKVNYYFFLQEYKRESELAEYEDLISNESNGVVYNFEDIEHKELYDKKISKIKNQSSKYLGLGNHKRFFNSSFINSEKSYYEKHFFDFEFREYYDETENLFVFSNVVLEKKAVSGFEFFNMSEEEYNLILNDFLLNFSYTKTINSKLSEGILTKSSILANPTTVFMDFSDFEELEEDLFGNSERSARKLDKYDIYGNMESNKLIQKIKEAEQSNISCMPVIGLPSKSKNDEGVSNLVLDFDGDEKKEPTMSEFFFEYFVCHNLNCTLYEVFNYYLKDSSFISTFRNPVQRIYTLKDNPIFSQVLSQMIKTKEKSEEEKGVDNIHLVFMNKYINEFKLGNGVVLERNSEGLGTHIYIMNNEKKILLADMGYGISQILPLIFQIVLAGIENDGKLTKLFIEEPEANLHPALQSKLADMFVDAAHQFNIQFVIETHSEYLIRRLQVLTANTYTETNKNENWSELKTTDTQLYYFYQADAVPEGEEQVYKINIEEDGALTKNFGKGFFDESSNLNIALYNFTTANKN